MVSDAEAPPPNPQVLPQTQGALAAVGDKIVRMASGVGVLIDWLGEGGQPVEKSIADKRASVCAVCPLNGKGDLTRYFTVPAAELVRKQIEQRKDLYLKTDFDEQLGICEACGCPLKTKVFVPIQYIGSHMSQEVKSELHSSCWILSELT